MEDEVTCSTLSLSFQDFHCHLSTGEVSGYLGGRYDPVNKSEPASLAMDVIL